MTLKNNSLSVKLIIIFIYISRKIKILLYITFVLEQNKYFVNVMERSITQFKCKYISPTDIFFVRFARVLCLSGRSLVRLVVDNYHSTRITP